MSGSYILNEKQINPQTKRKEDLCVRRDFVGSYFQSVQSEIH